MKILRMTSLLGCLLLLTISFGASSALGGTIYFDEAAVTDVKVNGVPATGSGKVWTWSLWDNNIPEGKQNFNITWTNKDGSKGEGKTVAYTVKAADDDG